MSVGTRKILYIDGVEADTEEGSVSFEKGGLEGEPEVSDNRFAGVSLKFVPGRVKAKILLNKNLDKKWWTPNVTFDVEVEMPETGEVCAFANMPQILTYKADGKSVEIEFVGPEGTLS